MTTAAQQDDGSTNTGEAIAGGALIVTWNPGGEGKWRRVEYGEAIERTARGEFVLEDWSTGRRKKGVSWGDRVFMLQQGTRGRGIIASGIALGGIYPIKHWRTDRPNEIANNLVVQWKHVVAVDDGIPLDELQNKLPASHNWTFKASGVLIEPELANGLDELWSNRVRAIIHHTTSRTAHPKTTAELTQLAVDQVPLAAIETERSEVELSIQTTVTQEEAQLTCPRSSRPTVRCGSRSRASNASAAAALSRNVSVRWPPSSR